MFDKKRGIENIYALAKAKGLKIGDIEEKAGVSKGYLSRINKEDSTSIPTIDLLASIAEQLEVGIDFLVNYPIGTISPNEEFVYQFIDKLTTATTAGKMEWIPETEGLLRADTDVAVKNPLVYVTKNYSDEVDIWYDTHGYTSGIYSGGSVEVIGDCYYASLPSSNATVFLNSVRYFIPKEGGRFASTETFDAIEVYLVTNGVKPICSTYYVCEAIKKAVKDLYTAVSSAPSHIGLEYSTKAVMQSFMKGFTTLSKAEDEPS